MSPSFMDLEESVSREEMATLIDILKESALDVSVLAVEVRDAVMTCMLNAFGFGIIKGIHKQKTKRSRRRKETNKTKNESKNE